MTVSDQSVAGVRGELAVAQRAYDRARARAIAARTPEQIRERFAVADQRMAELRLVDRRLRGLL